MLQIAPNNEFILLRTDNHTKLEVRDYQSSQLLANLKLDSRGQPSTEFSLDGEHILTSQSYDPVLYIRDVKTLEVVRTLQNDLPVDWFRLTPDGQHVLVGQPYADGRHLVAKWNIETGQRTWSRVGPASETGFFSKSGQYFLTMSGWNMSAMWDIHNGRPCCVIISESNDRPDQSDFYFSKDERSLHLGSADGYLLWSQEN